MGEFRNWFRTLSHSLSGIRNGCILIVGMGLLLSAGIQGVKPAPAPRDLIGRLYQMHLWMTQDEKGPAPSLPASSEDADALWMSLLQGRNSTPPDDKAAPGVRLAYGLGKLRRGEVDPALHWLRQENRHHPHPLVRQIVLRTALNHRRTGVIEELLSDPGYGAESEGAFGVLLGLERNDWGMILRHFWKAQYGRLRMDALILALVAGAVWAGMIAGLHPAPFRPRKLLPLLAALALGWMSTWPTVWSGMWMDHHLHLSEGNDFFSALAYFILSVGVREELCKLLLFTPFLVWTARRHRDTDALILGALVGLGFAIEENIGYLDGGPGGVMVARFVSANILHFTLTGAAALALARLVRDPRKWLADSLQVLGMAIGLHGLYNTLLSQPVPGLGDLSYFSGAALAGCVFLFFREASTLCPPRPRTLSQTALFCWGFCLILNLEMVQAAVLLSWRDALDLTGQAALAGVFSGYIFLRHIHEPLQE